jgi:putative ABC transport system ATP-binding protein
MTNYFIDIKNLSKGFQEGGNTRRVLENANLSLPAGKFTAIIGRSGSGKSTLLNLISGIEQPDSGEIWLDGSSLTAMDERQRTLFRRTQIGFVFQFFNLLPTLTVQENITLPLEISGVRPAEARTKAAPLLEAVGLADRANTYPDRLSGGEQQRVAIARALVNDPKLVLADEPTGNLDRNTGQSVLTLLDELTRQANKNLIMVTHSIASTDQADLIFRLKGGKLHPEIA